LVGDPARNVPPLTWIGALAEKPSELFERRRLAAQDSVRMMVDEPDGAQYFKK
jgi:hypothetical protein